MMLGEDLHQVLREIAASQVEVENGMREGIAFVDRHRVGDAVAKSRTMPVARPEAYSERTAWMATYIILSHLFTVGLWVQRRLSEQNGVFLWGFSQFVVESMVPVLLHVVPVGDNAVLNRVLEREDAALGLLFNANV